MIAPLLYLGPLGPVIARRGGEAPVIARRGGEAPPLTISDMFARLHRDMSVRLLWGRVYVAELALVRLGQPTQLKQMKTPHRITIDHPS